MIFYEQLPRRSVVEDTTLMSRVVLRWGEDKIMGDSPSDRCDYRGISMSSVKIETERCLTSAGLVAGQSLVGR
jgi:hypothetical protein